MNTRDFFEELYQALKAVDEPRARALLTEGADINDVDKDGWPMLIAVADTNVYEAIRLCLQLGADRTAECDGYNLPHSLLDDGRYDVLLRLIDDGLWPVDFPDSCGATALMRGCAITSSEDLTQALINRGASVCRADARGVTAFGYAIDEIICNFEHFPLLLAAGADINSRDEKGRTALMVYAMGKNESPDYISFFLEHGADVNLRDPEGKTALGYAYDTLERVRRENYVDEWILAIIEELKSYGAEL